MIHHDESRGSECVALFRDSAYQRPSTTNSRHDLSVKVSGIPGIYMGFWAWVYIDSAATRNGVGRYRNQELTGLILLCRIGQGWFRNQDWQKSYVTDTLRWSKLQSFFLANFSHPLWKKKWKVPNVKGVFVFFFVFLGEKMDPSHHIISHNFQVLFIFRITKLCEGKYWVFKDIVIVEMKFS
jgi:hypothetical protein